MEWKDIIDDLLQKGADEIDAALDREGVGGEIREGVKDLAKLYVEIQFAKTLGRDIGEAERAADAARRNYQAAGVITASDLAKKVASSFLQKVAKTLQAGLLI